MQKSLSKASPEELRDLNQEKEESKGSKIFKFEKIDLVRQLIIFIGFF